MSRSARRHLLVARTVAGGSPYDRLVLAAHPVLYLTLDGTASGYQDASGHGHDAAVYGSPTAAAGPGDGEGAVMFNGTTQWAELSDHDDFSVPTTGVLTVEAWISPAVADFSVAEGTGPYVHWAGKLGTHSSTVDAEWVCRMYNYTSYRPNRISGYAFNPDGGWGTGSYFEDPVALDEWIHYALVINMINVSGTYATGYTKIFKNGLLRDQDALTNYATVPQNCTAPVRIGSATLDSFFQGRIARFAVYPYELSAIAIRDHYRAIYPPVPGTTAFYAHVGTASTTTTGTKLQLVVGSSGVQAGHTLLCTVSQSWTNSAPTMADNRGNVYTLDKTSSDSPSNTIRSAMFHARIDNALRGGDIIEVTTPSTTTRLLTVDEFYGIAFTSPVDGTPASISGISTTPGASTSSSASITTTNADDMIYASTMVVGPTTDTYTEDADHFYLAASSAGTNTGTGDLTTHAAYQPVAQVDAFKHQPTLNISRHWMNILAAFKAGDSTPTPTVPGTTSRVGQVAAGTSTTAGTTLVLTVGGDGVAAQHTVIVRVVADYTTNGPTIVDSRGNTYTRDRQAADAGSTIRAAIYSAPVATALQPGDTITLTWATSITRRAVVADDMAGVAGPTVIDVQNGATNTGTAPSVSVTTTNGDDLVVAMVGIAGQMDDGFTEDVVRQWIPLGIAGTTGSGAADRTVHGAIRSPSTTGTFTYNPTLAVSSTFVALAVAYRAGVNTVTPPDPGASVHVKLVDATSSTAAGATLVLTVPTGGVATGHTLILRFCADYTAGSPTIVDSRGNTWTVDRSGPLPGNVSRSGIASTAVTTPLLAGDTITLTWPASGLRRAAACDEWSAILTPTVVNATNGGSGTSNTPTATLTTTTPDCLLVVATGVAGPVGATWVEDGGNLWTGLTAAGTSGDPVPATDRSVRAAYRGVTATNRYTYAPTTDGAPAWATFIVAYQVD